MGVPFKIADVHGGFSEAVGTIYLNDEFFVIEYRIVTLGMFKRSVHTLKIELGVIADVALKKRLFRDKLLILPKKLSVLDAVPGKNKEIVTLKIKRKYRTETKRIVNEIKLRQVESP